MARRLPLEVDALVVGKILVTSITKVAGMLTPYFQGMVPRL